MSIPQKLLTQGLTSITRGGMDNSVYDSPGNVMADDYNVKNPIARAAVGLPFDFTVDPLVIAGAISSLTKAAKAEEVINADRRIIGLPETIAPASPPPAVPSEWKLDYGDVPLHTRDEMRQIAANEYQGLLQEVSKPETRAFYKNQEALIGDDRYTKYIDEMIKSGKTPYKMDITSLPESGKDAIAASKRPTPTNSNSILHVNPTQETTSMPHEYAHNVTSQLVNKDTGTKYMILNGKEQYIPMENYNPKTALNVLEDDPNVPPGTDFIIGGATGKKIEFSTPQGKRFIFKDFKDLKDTDISPEDYDYLTGTYINSTGERVINPTRVIGTEFTSQARDLKEAMVNEGIIPDMNSSVTEEDVNKALDIYRNDKGYGFAPNPVSRSNYNKNIIGLIA